jgi:hypothetical protein
MAKATPKTKNTKHDKILKDFAALAKKLRRDVKMSDLIASGYTKDTITHHYQSLSNLDQKARAKYPNSFYDISISDLYSQKALEDLRSKVGATNRFVVTTAVTGCQVDDKFYASLKNYCAINKATLLILVASDPANNRDPGGYGNIDRKLSNEIIVMEDVALNTNVFISTIKLSAKHIDPITGLGRIGQRHGSFIYASPKQRLKPVPTSNDKLPHFLMTTGAITKPNYKTTQYMSERTAYIADNDHVMGAVVVEIQDDAIYHFRQIQADPESGALVDLGKMYTGKKVINYAPEAFVLGDWHSGETDPVVEKCIREAIVELSIKKIILHDAFNGMSINHHEQHSKLLKAHRASQDQLSLGQELLGLARDLDSLVDLCEEVIVVKSNHDEFLERYLQSGRIFDDPHNTRISLKLSEAVLDGLDPVQVGVELLGLVNKDKVRWLKRDEDYFIARIQLGSHGDKGANGSRGSLHAMENAYGNSITGHSHTPEILRGAWSVGTSSYLKLDYNKGPSSWLQTSCLVYPNGARQLINIIEGAWRLKD